MPLVLEIGNTEGHDKLCGRYFCHSNKVKYQCWYYNCEYNNLSNPENGSQTALTVQQDISDLISAGSEAELNAICMHLVDNACHKLFYGACSRGIHGACLADILHTLQQGLHQRLVDEYFLLKKLSTKALAEQADRNRQQSTGRQKFKEGKDDRNCDQTVAKELAKAISKNEKLVGKKDSEIYQALSKDKQSKFFCFSESVKEEMNNLSKKLGRILQHQSDRDLPRCYFSSGFTTNAKINAHEQEGILLVMLVLMCSYKGYTYQKAMGWWRYNAWVELIELMLTLEEWMKMSEFSKSEVDNVEGYIPLVLEKYGRIVARTEGNGF